MIRDARPDDAEVIASIYNYYVVHTPVTFEEEPVTASQMAVRIDDVVSMSLPWIVLEQDASVVGYAYATKWKAQCVSLLGRVNGVSGAACYWTGTRNTPLPRTYRQTPSIIPIRTEYYPSRVSQIDLDHDAVTEA